MSPRQPHRGLALAAALLVAAIPASAEKKLQVRIPHPPGLADVLSEARVIFGPVSGRCSKEFAGALAQDLAAQGIKVVAQAELDALAAEHHLEIGSPPDPAASAALARLLGPAVMFSLEVSRGEARPRQPMMGSGLPATHISRTDGHFLATLRVIDLASGQNLAVETIRADPHKQNESQTGSPEYPSGAELIEMALAEADAEARRLWAPWMETREVSFMDDKDCNLKQAYDLLRAGDYRGAVKLSRENAESCRSNPKIASAAWYNLGVAYMLLGKCSNALSALAEAQKLRDNKLVADLTSEARKCRDSAAAAARRIAARYAQAEAANQRNAEVQTGILMTNELVIKLVQQYVADDVIAGLIASSPARFSLEPDDLQKLTQAGVPDSVLAAMRAKK